METPLPCRAPALRLGLAALCDHREERDNAGGRTNLVDPTGQGIPNRVIVVFVGLQLLDVLTTMLGLRVGAHEGNFLVAQFMHWGPALGLLIAKFLGFLLLLVAFAAGKLRLLRLLNLWFLCIVFWNLAIIWIQILGGAGQ